MSTVAVASAAASIPLWGPLAGRLVYRNVVVGRRSWLLFVSGFFEPVFFLLGIGLGVGALVGDVSYDGELVPYKEFVAPAMLAASAMNGAVYRVDDQRLREAQVAEDVRRRSRHAARRTRRGARRAHLRAHPRRRLRGRLCRRDARDGPDRVVVGRAGGTGGDTRRRGVRRRRPHRCHVHALVGGLLDDRARDAAALPLLGDVRTALRLPGGGAVDRAADAAVPRSRASARLDAGDGRLGHARTRRVPRC